MIEALKKFNIYLKHQEFKIATDCSAFEQTLNKKELAPRLARWQMLLTQFKYKTEHRWSKDATRRRSEPSFERTSY